MDAKQIKKTQDTLGKVVKKPPLTDKLLGKPPFRFLHDIITSADFGNDKLDCHNNDYPLRFNCVNAKEETYVNVIKTTGFMKGLFTDNEMSSENVKEKEAKVEFLQKAIDMVCLVTARTLTVKPSKIVAGHEPEKTNEFLQALAEAINKKVDNDDYVRRVLKTEKPASGDKKSREKSSDRRRRDKDSSKEKERSKDSRGDKKSRDRSRDGKDKSQDQEKENERERSRDKKDRGKSRDRRKDDRDSADRDRRRRRDKDKEEEPAVNGHDAQEEAQRIPRPTSAKGSRRRHDPDDDESAEKRPSKAKQEMTNADDTVPPQVQASRKMARPPSARPAAPRVKKNDAPPDEPVIMGGSHVPNVITDKQEDSEEEDDGFGAMTQEEEDAAPPPQQMSQANAEDDGEHGGLVKKILHTKDKLEAGGQQQQQTRTQIERSTVNEANRRKEREMVQKEIDKLRGSIQTLTRSVNPLGKIMDFVQEDLDSMQKELENWKTENKTNTKDLQREQSVTDSSVEPLRAQLSELDQAIGDQLDLIAAVKSNVIRNDGKIQKMLGSISKS